ncbi:hypothetical protein [Pedobacter sp.]|uniref:hypothetical protein n=1 Tax=Pedobacter sp. TaxID=1411316 RepID=UPI003D7FE44C
MIPKMGNALWLYDDDFKHLNFLDKIGNLFSGVKPLHSHAGLIGLENGRICLESESDTLEIALIAITQIYLGFDKNYKRAYVKNFGTTWQPLKITFTTLALTTRVVYLIIDFNYFSTSNKHWYDLLQERLS